MAKCRGCGAEIIWIMSSSGKLIPCDPELVRYWQKPKAKGKIVTPIGEVLSCEFEGEQDEATGYGYVSHFSTCPQAGEFRRKKK